MSAGISPSGTGHNLVRRAVQISLGTSIAIMAVKCIAYGVTRSSAVLGDAAESVVHIAAVAFTVYSVRLSVKPADEEHPYGHAKVTYFAAGFEGALVCLASLVTIGAALAQWLGFSHSKELGTGAWLVGGAAAVNAALGWTLLQLGRRRHSLVLEANGWHTLSDVITSAGAVAGLLLARGTGWAGWEPLAAGGSALGMVWSGIMLVRRSISGLMDAADPADREQLEQVLRKAGTSEGIEWHGLRHRRAGDQNFVELHVVFPDETALRDAHAAATRLEEAIRRALGGGTHVLTHLECASDQDGEHP
jgi:cation diffusion facilitator family transporter